MEKSIFNTLNEINVNEHTEQKNGLTYLSWAWAWKEVKTRYADANYKIYERESEYGAINYFTDGKTCWVKTGVTINGLEHIEYLPIMDYRNKSIPLEQVTSFDVNKAIQRSLTKAVARHGLGLYIYAGEDLPEQTVTNSTIKISPEQKEKLKKLNVDFDKLKEFYHKSDIDELTSIEAENAIDRKLKQIHNVLPIGDDDVVVG